ncbi:MAG: hypothetical protein D6E12_09715 [Desulfovibrio sp.]|nr:MAG: hypothetical protein D6E12_09715 [Desulfovibrio sp.]
MNKSKLIIGLLLVAGAAVAAVLFGLTDDSAGPIDPDDLTVVSIRYGSEKKGFLHDEDVQRILAEKYGLYIDGTKMGSLEMAEGDLSGVDGLWPSSDLAAQVFERRQPGTHFKKHNVFNTPIVFYSWPDVTDALISAGVVEKRDNTYYVVDTVGLLTMVKEGRTWEDVGLQGQFGTIKVHFTDPTKSNSGFLFAGLMAILFNGGDMVTDSNLMPVMKEVVAIRDRMGFLENSTGILFNKYLTQGKGAYPLVSAYENLLIEFYLTNPQYQEDISRLVRVLIPEPTVWSEHPFIALTDKGEALLAALQDEEILALAWEKHGFRTGLVRDASHLEQFGLPERIDSVTPLPSPEIMERLIDGLR